MDTILAAFLLEVEGDWDQKAFSIYGFGDNIPEKMRYFNSMLKIYLEFIRTD